MGKSFKEFLIVFVGLYILNILFGDVFSMYHIDILKEGICFYLIVIFCSFLLKKTMEFFVGIKAKLLYIKIFFSILLLLYIIKSFIFGGIFYPSQIVAIYTLF